MFGSQTSAHAISTPSPWEYKGWPEGLPLPDRDHPLPADLDLFTSGFMFPIATVDKAAVLHNVETVAAFCRETGIDLAPHGKTTMSPELIGLQLDAGAWGITAATASQARVFRAHGVERILIAHQLVDPAGVRWAFDEMQRDERAHVLCLADSTAGVERMEAALDGAPPQLRPLDVLVELGLPGGRTGCREIDDAVAVAHRIRASPRLRLAGVEGYEGVVDFDSECFDEVDGFVDRIGSLAVAIDDAGLFDEVDEIIITAGGSTYPDRVILGLARDWHLSRPTRTVIRPGCYVTHDSGHYVETGPFGTREPTDSCPPLRDALRVWSFVVSRPEPDLALLGFGKRDASFDIDLPIPLEVHRNGTLSAIPQGAAEVFALDDQHAYVRLDATQQLEVGDIIGCGISHPCTTFDRWRLIPVVEDSHVVDVIHTYF